MDRIYDASAFLHMLVRGSARRRHFSGQAVLDLTRYELGKAIWNNLPHGRQDKQLLFERCLELLDEMSVLGVHGMEQDVADTAVSERLTFYDSAHVTVAERYRLELITDDGDMLEAARRRGIAAMRSDGA